jgi:hypothetical protein
VPVDRVAKSLANLRPRQSPNMVYSFLQASAICHLCKKEEIDWP